MINEILEIIKENPDITGRQIAKKLGINEQYAYGYLDCLVDNKIINKIQKYKTIANYELADGTKWILSD